MFGEKVTLFFVAVVSTVYGFLLGATHQAGKQKEADQVVIIIKDCTLTGAQSFECKTREEL